MPPTTVDAIVLLGWMEREPAVKCIREDCFFDTPISDEQAEAMWREKRQAVEDLGERDAVAPACLPLNLEEERAASRFIQHFRRLGAANIQEVLKVDPMGLVTHQHFINLDRARQYATSVQSQEGWIRHCVSIDPLPQQQIQMRHGPNAIDALIPHGEFMFGFNPAGGFGIQEFMKNVTVNRFEGRLWLWSGYHRSYARIANMAPDAIDRSLLVVRTTDGDFLVASNSPNQGLRDILRGRRPPLFRDFFDERLFMRVKLRKKRFELQIRAQVVGINVD